MLFYQYPYQTHRKVKFLLKTRQVILYQLDNPQIELKIELKVLYITGTKNYWNELLFFYQHKWVPRIT